MAKYHEYYDLLNIGKKDYQKEVNKILEISKDLCDHNIHRILEVGCGTGNHTIPLSQSALVSACDIDEEMLKIAKSKTDSTNISYYSDIAHIKEYNHDMCLMMWNVINYFPDVKTIHHVFLNASKRLRKDAPLIFDMWNGVAVIRDLPRTSVNKIDLGNNSIIGHHLIGKTSLMDMTTEICNEITLYKDGSMKDNFKHTVKHYIWTVKTIKDLLEINKFNLIKIAKTSDYVTNADDKDWHVIVIAQKK